MSVAAGRGPPIRKPPKKKSEGSVDRVPSEAVSRDPVHHSSFTSRAGRPEEVDGHAPLSSDQMTSADQARAFPSCAATVECCAPIMKSTSLSLVQPESAVAE
ncbi:hypothetical protein J7T55_010901 [Diaporthe amygdali]|uniref:uncharacterized protein n=1 Tax=Phomopsis amygdali TaxID=1214568 RepID=UPI0022FEA4A6|nr:uncharacterized protein J7T55_010901 [Diaporthe amygdali]KAJ0104435.1 hypothetical protein J7T55_010901 [Diaporthe amygdali]